MAKKATANILRKVEKKAVTKRKDDPSARAKRSRRKGASYERDIAKVLSEKFGLEFIRTPQSGGFAKKVEGTEQFRGDIVPANKGSGFRCHVECKCQQTWALPAWLKQAEGDCPEGSLPLVIFHKAKTSKNYVALSLEDFLEIVDVEKVLCKK